MATAIFDLSWHCSPRFDHRFAMSLAILPTVIFISIVLQSLTVSIFSLCWSASPLVSLVSPVSVVFNCLSYPLYPHIQSLHTPSVSNCLPTACFTYVHYIIISIVSLSLPNPQPIHIEVILGFQ